MIKILLFFSPVFICSGLCAQSDTSYLKVYKTNPKLEIPGPIIFFCGSYFGFKALDNIASLTEAEVKNLNPETINSFDRPVAFYNPAEFLSAQQTSDLFMNIFVASPALLLINKRIRHDWKDFASMFLMTHATGNVIYFASAFSVRRARPLTFNPAVPLADKIGDNKTNSFFSGHTAWTAMSTFFITKVYTDYHQIKGIKRILIYTGAAIPPGLVGYYRMEAGKHFKSDVITGLLIGAACGIGVPELHRIKEKNRNFSMRPFFMQGANGISLSYNIK